MRAGFEIKVAEIFGNQIIDSAARSGGRPPLPAGRHGCLAYRDGCFSGADDFCLGEQALQAGFEPDARLLGAAVGRLELSRWRFTQMTPD
jgi:hypothetical protein